MILISPLAREIPGSGSCQRLEGLTGEVGAWAHPVPDAAPWQTSPAAPEETPLAQVCEATEPPKKRGRTDKIQPPNANSFAKPPESCSVTPGD